MASEKGGLKGKEGGVGGVFFGKLEGRDGGRVCIGHIKGRREGVTENYLDGWYKIAQVEGPVLHNALSISLTMR